MPTADDRHRITSLAELRARMGEPHPATPHKVFDALDEQMTAFLARSPFCLLATSDAEGNLEVSPKGDGPGFVLTENPRSLVVPDRMHVSFMYSYPNHIPLPCTPRCNGMEHLKTWMRARAE
jgi:hypothetical protein